METNIFILLGSNLGDREQYIADGKKRIQHAGCVISRTSSLYQTAPWGKTDQPDFLNQVICVSTEFTPRELLKALLRIETVLGRTRNEKWSARTIDIDILFFDNQIINTEELTVPHPGIALRRFTLLPLSEIAPDFVHPVINLSCRALLEKCSDSSIVEKYEP